MNSLRAKLLLLLTVCLLATACASEPIEEAASTPTTRSSDSSSTDSSTEATATTESTNDADPSTTSRPTTNDTALFPRSVDHALGTTEIPALPSRIVSASATMTGHLLAIGAPVVSAQALPPQSPLSDDNGFLIQWGQVAVDAGVEAIAGPEVNIEAIAAARPDLIVANSFGGDAVTEDVYALLREIAPTIVIDHSGMQWQDLAVLLGDITGRPEAAATTISEFEAEVAAAAPQLNTGETVFPAVVTASGINALTADSSHGKLFESLGFNVPEIEGSNLIDEAGQATRSDVVSISPENVIDVVGEARFLFILSTPEQVPELLDTFPTLAVLPSISTNSALALGVESFRIDRYSASIILDRLVDAAG